MCGWAAINNMRVFSEISCFPRVIWVLLGPSVDNGTRVQFHSIVFANRNTIPLRSAYEFYLVLVDAIRELLGERQVVGSSLLPVMAAMLLQASGRLAWLFNCHATFQSS